MQLSLGQSLAGSLAVPVEAPRGQMGANLAEAVESSGLCPAAGPHSSLLLWP